MTPFYVDSHCHVDDAQFDPDRDAVIARARAAGVRYLLAIGGASGPESIDAGLRIAERFADVPSSETLSAPQEHEPEARESPDDWICAAGGVHPHDAAKAEETHFDTLRRLAEHPKFRAIGEIGLDYFSDRSPREVQKQVFIRQLEIAGELGLPVAIHCRDAWPDMRAILRTHWHPGPTGGKPRGILHCFSGTQEDAAELMSGGFMVSFAGNITFKNAEELRAVAREIPLDRLLTETDCPYLAPVPYRGKRNEPAYVREVTRQLAALHNIPEEGMAGRVAENFVQLFGLPFRLPAGPVSQTKAGRPDLPGSSEQKWR